VSDDITTRLRRDCMSLIADEAANEIERLRADVMCLKYQNAEFVRNLTMAQDERNTAVTDLDQAMRQVDRLWDDCIRLTKRNTEALKQRDEARRMACRYEASYNGVMFDNPKYSDAIAIAKAYEWDCFDQEGTK
jgi:hypothetical protein